MLNKYKNFVNCVINLFFSVAVPRSKTGVKRVKFSKDILEEAIRAVLEGKSVREAAREYSITKSTLWNYVKAHQTSGSATVNVKLGRNDTQQVFSKEQESELASYLDKAARLHYGLTKKDARSLAFQYADINNINCPEKWKTEKLAGKQWLRGFLKRWSELSLRKPEATSLARSTSFNKENVKKFFENYKEVLSRHTFTQHNIYNLDETGNSTVHVPPKIIAPKGIKQVGSMTSSERGVNVTMIACVNAAGNHVPPILIFPRVHFKQYMLNGAPPGSIGGANPSGWSNEQLFVQYLDHFISFVKPSKDDPVLLILDNHDSHISIEGIVKAKEAGVIMLTFPPHTSHKLQPLDRTVFGPYKTFYNTAVAEWMLSNPGKPVSIYEIAHICGKAFLQAFTAKNIISGFEVTGIHPVNENIFKEEEYLSSYVTDRPNPYSPSTQEKQAIASTSFSSKSDSNTVPTVSPHIIRPFPKAPERKVKGGRKRGKSMIMTDTPEKKAIEFEKSKKNKNKPTRPTPVCKKVKRVLTYSSSDNESDEDEIMSDSEEDSLAMLREDVNLRESESAAERSFLEERTIKEGSFVLVRLVGKKSTVFYIAEVTAVVNDSDYQVKYLKRVGNTQKFIRENEDIYDILARDVEMILPLPTSVGGSERQVSQLSFSIDFSFYNVR